MDYLNRYYMLIRDLMNSSSLPGRLSRNAVGSVVVRVVAVLLAFLVNVVLARSLGVSEYGLFVYAVGWLNILLILANFGFEKLLVREIAIYQSHEEWGRLKGIYQFAATRTAVIALMIGFLLLGIIYFTARSHSYAPVFYLVAMLLPILAMMRIQQATLQGLNFIAIGQLPELVIQPCVLLLLTLVIFYSLAASLTASQIMILNLVAGCIALLVGKRLVMRSFPLKTLAAHAIIDSHRWLPSLAPLMFVGGIYILNDQLATVLLGSLSDSRQVAIFSVAERWSRFVVFMLYSLNPALAPIFASLYAHNEKERLQRVASLSAQIIACFALIPLVAFALAPKLFLSLFGNEFSLARIPLMILGVGQFVNAFAGSVGMLLSMTGYERIVVLGAGLGIALNILLGFLLIPHFHAIGAAIGASSSAIVTNIVLSIFVFQKLKLFPTALGSLFMKKDVTST
jgi:O-antigen/teichoic acid export membrane protein